MIEERILFLPFLLYRDTLDIDCTNLKIPYDIEKTIRLLGGSVKVIVGCGVRKLYMEFLA